VVYDDAVSLPSNEHVCSFLDVDFNRNIILFALLANIPGALFPGRSLQPSFRNELQVRLILLRVATDQHLPEERIGYLWASSVSDQRFLQAFYGVIQIVLSGDEGWS